MMTLPLSTTTKYWARPMTCSTTRRTEQAQLRRQTTNHAASIASAITACSLAAESGAMSARTSFQGSSTEKNAR